MAEAWIETHARGYEADELATFAITLKPTDELVGAIGLTINRPHAPGGARILGRPPILEPRVCHRGRPGGAALRNLRAHRHPSDTPWRAAETRDAVEFAIAQLPADQRIALLFRYLDGLTVREVSTVIGRSEKATESLLSRARDGFRRAYGGRTDG